MCKSKRIQESGSTVGCAIWIPNGYECVRRPVLATFNNIQYVKLVEVVEVVDVGR